MTYFLELEFSKFQSFFQRSIKFYLASENIFDHSKSELQKKINCQQMPNPM